MSSLVSVDETRAQARSRRRAEASARKAAAADAARERRAAAVAAREVFTAGPVPATGRRGPASLRGPASWATPAHRATSATLSAAYPFLAEDGLGASGMLIGTDAFSRAAFVFDPWELYRSGVLTNPNITVAGVIGRGKSALMKSLVLRSMAFGRRAYVPGDPKGEWSALSRAVGGSVIRLGPGSSARLNPLDAGTRPRVDHLGEPVTDEGWRLMVARRRLDLLVALAATLLGRGLLPEEHQATAAALSAATETNPEPVLPHVVDHLLSPSPSRPLPPGVASLDQLAADGRQVGYTLARLVRGDLLGMFDGPSTARFDTTAPMVSVDLSALGADSAALPVVMTCTSAWMEAALRDPRAGQRWVVYDEAWKIMAHGPLLHRMQEQWKLSRHWGLANALIIHRLSDLHAVGSAGSAERALASGLLADTSTRVVYRQESDQIPGTVAALGLSRPSGSILDTLARGQGLWQVGERAFVVNHHLTRTERQLFDTDQAMLG